MWQHLDSRISFLLEVVCLDNRQVAVRKRAFSSLSCGLLNQTSSTTLPGPLVGDSWQIRGNSSYFQMYTTTKAMCTTEGASLSFRGLVRGVEFPPPMSYIAPPLKRTATMGWLLFRSALSSTTPTDSPEHKRSSIDGYIRSGAVSHSIVWAQNRLFFFPAAIHQSCSDVQPGGRPLARVPPDSFLA